MGDKDINGLFNVHENMSFLSNKYIVFFRNYIIIRLFTVCLCGTVSLCGTVQPPGFSSPTVTVTPIQNDLIGLCQGMDITSQEIYI